MTREEFTERYAAKSGVTQEFLAAHGEEAQPCDCGEAGCQGWQMVSARSSEDSAKISTIAASDSSE